MRTAAVTVAAVRLLWLVTAWLQAFTADALTERNTMYVATTLTERNTVYVATTLGSLNDNASASTTALLKSFTARSPVACGFACFANAQCLAFYFASEAITKADGGIRCDLLGQFNSSLNYTTAFVDVAGSVNGTATTTEIVLSSTKIGLTVQVNYWGTGAGITVAVPPPKPSFMALYEVHLPCTSATIASIWSSNAMNTTLLASQGTFVVSQTDWQLSSPTFGFNLGFPQGSCPLITSSTVFAYQLF